MGASGAKAHETFTVAPTHGSDIDGVGGVDGGDAGVAVWTDGGHAAFANIVAAVTKAGDFEDFVSMTQIGTGLLAELTDAGVPAQVIGDAAGELKAATKAWLSGLDVQQLQGLAAANGFEHPTLVGLNPSPESTHPLVHWLDPAYPDTTPSKAKIAAKATERFGALAAGETIGGLSFDDVVAAEAALTNTTNKEDDDGDVDDGGGSSDEDPFGSWIATAEQIAELQAAHAASVTGKHFPYLPETQHWLASVLATENKLVTATCPSLNDDAMVKIKAATVHLTDMAVSFNHQYWMGKILAADALPGISPEQTSVATNTEAWTMVRASTSNDVRAALAATFAERLDAVAYMTDNATWITEQMVETATGAKLNLVADSPDTLAQFATKAGSHIVAANVLRGGSDDGSKTAWIGLANLPKVAWTECSAAGLTKAFRGWAKDKPLGQLRSAAATLGLPNATTATRAQAQNYLAAHWDTTLDKTAIDTQTTTPKPAPPTPAPAPTMPAPSPPANLGPSSPAPSSSPPASAAKASSGSTAPSTGGDWTSKHVAAIDALKHHLAGHQALPQRVPAATVESWTFGPAKTASLGGGHSKSLHAAPDGTMWLFKPDKSAAGARAHAESVASNVFAVVGIPAVPVYAKTIGGHTGSIQPLLPNTSNLGNNVGAWSQADVDSIVRLHVAAWAISDHDGHGANLLRTAQGGLIPCDQGQAFKFFGADKLSSSYHPNASFGTQQPVYMQAYAAAKNGGLATGVTIRPEAALPVIKAFEAMPDDQYRAMLQPAATEGTKRDGNGIGWYAPMRARAAKQHGTTTPSKQQIADAFLDYAVERKHRLRQDFAAFYAADGIAHKLDLVS